MNNFAGNILHLAISIILLSYLFHKKVSIMDFIKHYFFKLLSWIDNGMFFINPTKWGYTILAWLSFLLPIAAGILFYMAYEEDVFGSVNGWDKYSLILLFIVFFVFVCVAAYMNYLFWIHRRSAINSTVKVGDQIVTIPVFAHFVQSWGESAGLLLGLLPSIAVVLLYLWGILTGFHNLDLFDNFFKNLFGGLVVVILVVAACCYVGYCHVFIARWLGECMRLRAQIANDVRDLGDIHRAATFEVPEEVNEETVPTEE